MIAGFLLLLFFFYAGAPAAGEAKKDIGLSVEPGWLLIRDVPVGQLYDADNVTKTLFKVHNGSDQSRHYSLKADKPEKVGVNVLKGYAGIPDPDWFWFETNEVATPANGAVEIKMFARIPDEEIERRFLAALSAFYPRGPCHHQPSSGKSGI